MTGAGTTPCGALARCHHADAGKGTRHGYCAEASCEPWWHLGQAAWVCLSHAPSREPRYPRTRYGFANIGGQIRWKYEARSIPEGAAGVSGKNSRNADLRFYAHFCCLFLIPMKPSSLPRPASKVLIKSPLFGAQPALLLRQILTSRPHQSQAADGEALNFQTRSTSTDARRPNSKHSRQMEAGL